jgi:hypothetical protein
VTAGPALFADSLAAQGVTVTRVDWQPPSADGGLAALWCEAVDAANRLALDRLLAAHPVLVDVRPAIEVVPAAARGGRRRARLRGARADAGGGRASRRQR